MPISAYVPCFNNSSTLARALDSIRKQSVPISELIVIDDGSKDNSFKIAQDLGVRIVRHGRNAGRGAVRSRAMREAAHDIVLSCDATNALPPDFVHRALPWFESAKVAAVFGRMWQEDNSTAALRWRGRHLFKMDVPQTVNQHASLATWAVMMRKSYIMDVGNFSPDLRHSEDADLGERLLAKGYEVVCDPGIRTLPLVGNTLLEVLERYWRWYAGKDERISWKGYARQIVFSIKVMARRDFQAGDPLSVPISLFSPHYQFWKSFWRKFRKSATFR